MARHFSNLPFRDWLVLTRISVNGEVENRIRASRVSAHIGLYLRDTFGVEI